MLCFYGIEEEIPISLFPTHQGRPNRPRIVLITEYIKPYLDKFQLSADDAPININILIPFKLNSSFE